MRSTIPGGFAVTAAVLTAVFGACNSSVSGPEACIAAGGKCVFGGAPNCASVGPQDCNPDRNPGGAVCCLGFPSTDAGSDGGDAASPTDAGADGDADCPSDLKACPDCGVSACLAAPCTAAPCP